MASVESLTQSGWRLSAEAFTPPGPNPSHKELLHHALNADLKDVGKACVADLLATVDANSVLSVPSEGLVLQIGKLRNVAAPKANEESSAAPRMLRLSLTDGHAWLHCVEVSRLERIGFNTPPGTKVRLTPNAEIPYAGGFLQVGPSHLEMLGGRVETLAERWEIGRKMAQFTRAKPSGGSGPPPWIPFGKKLSQMQASADKDFKALGGDVTGKKEKGPTKETAEFDSQRQGAIEEAAKQGTKKTFGGGKAEIREMNTRRQRRDRGKDKDVTEGSGRDGVSHVAPADEEEGSRGGRKKGRRGAREDEYEAKPTSGVSLYDFLEKDFPGAHDIDEPPKSSGRHERSEQRQQDRGSESRREDFHRNRDGGGGGGRGNRGGRRQVDGGRGGRDGGGGQRNGGDHRQQRYQNRTDGGPPPRQQKENPRGPRAQNQQMYSDRSGGYQERRGDRGGDRGGGGRNRSDGGGGGGRQPKVSSDRDFGEWSNSTYHDSAAARKVGGGKRDLAGSMDTMRLDDDVDRNLPDSYPRGNRQQSQRVNGSIHDDYGGFQHQLPVGNRRQQQQPFSGRQQSSRCWAEGEHCMSKYWEDGQFYPAVVTALTKTTAVVFFKEYGNYEEVMLTDLRPAVSGGGGNNNSFIPATPGLPPAFPQL